MTKGEGKRNTKCLAYVVAFVIFQAAILLVFALTVMKIKSPKVRFGAVAVDNISSGNTTSAPAFNMRLLTQLNVKNTNFGHFKYENTTLYISYAGMTVGEAVIPRARAKARKTRTTNIIVDISSDRLPMSTNLGSDINSGILRLSSQTTLRGKVQLMKVIKKNKSGVMSCTMAVNLVTRAVQDLSCR